MSNLEPVPAPPALGHYRQFVVAKGESVHIAGQVAVDESGTLVGQDDAVAQAERVAANLAAVLADAGLDPADLASVRVYATIPEAAAAWGEVRKRLFSEAPPASTLVYVSGLAHPDFLIEVEGIATRA